MSSEQSSRPQPPPLPTAASVVASKPVEPTALERGWARFHQALGGEILTKGQQLVDQAVAQIVERKAYFRRETVVQRALNNAQHQVSDSVLENEAFPKYIQWLVDTRTFQAVGRTNYVTTSEMWRDEQTIIDLAGRKVDLFRQPLEVVEEAIARKVGISEEQSEAVRAAALSPNAVTVIEGSAGAGKSFTMETVKEIYMAQGYHVIGTALGWAAAKVLGESAKLADKNCRAIEGLTQQWLASRADGVDPFPGPTLIIVDEAGMVGTRHMALILEQASLSVYPVKVVLTGDSYQMAPVVAGNALELIIKHHGTTRIDTIRRQHQASHRKMVKNLSKKHSGPALHTLLHEERLHWCRDSDMVLNMVVQHYVSYRLAHPNNKALVIALSNKDVLELNFRVRAAYKKLGLIGANDVRLKVTNGEDTFDTDFSEGDSVVLRANDKKLVVYEIDPRQSLANEASWKPLRTGVFNRNSGRIVHIRRGRDPVGSYDFVIDLDGDSPGRVVVNSATFKAYGKKGMPMLHNYAGTIYGSQGQTVSQVFLIDNPRMNFRLAYVGASRHKENLDVYLNETELHRRLDEVVGRRQSLRSHLDFKSSGKSAADATVALGRYTRGQMLQAVTLAWGKHSENLTATLFEYLKRTQTFAPSPNSKATTVASDYSVVDFFPQYNTAYPLVDVAKILQLPDPIEESELIRPSDVEDNRQKYAPEEMPIDALRTPLPLDGKASPRRADAGRLPTQPAPSGRFAKMFGWLLSDKSTPQPPPLPVVLRQDDPTAAFGAPPTVVEEGDPSLLSKSLARLNRWLSPNPKVPVPYTSEVNLCGRIEFPPFDPEIDERQRWDGLVDARPHYLSFEGVPSPVNAPGGPDREWVAAQKDHLWAVGRFGEPRILALSPKGEVVARYRMDGECVVGEGQAPIIVNRHLDAHGQFNKSVYIVAGAKEWLWLRQTLEETHADYLPNIPHIVWAAKDVDWGLLAPSLNKMERIVIVRSKSDDRQIPWALSLQRILLERHNIDTVISPAVPESDLNENSAQRLKM